MEFSTSHKGIVVRIYLLFRTCSPSVDMTHNGSYLGAIVPYLRMFAQDSRQSEHPTLVALVWEEIYKYVEEIEGACIMFLFAAESLRIFNLA